MRTDLTNLEFIIVAGANLAASELKQSLERRGAGVRVAFDCAAAFEAIEQRRPSFAVLDVAHSDCDAVASELAALDVPYVYVGTPSNIDRETVRTHMSMALADTMLAIAVRDEEDDLRA